MSSTGDNPDVWQLIFEQTPRALRWVFSVLTVGVFGLASILYRWRKEEMQRTREHVAHVEQRVDRLQEHMDDRFAQLNHQLVQIASNTEHRREDYSE